MSGDYTTMLAQLIRAELHPPVPVYASAPAQEPQGPYILIFPALEFQGERLDGQRRQLVTRWQLSCYSNSLASATRIAMTLADILDGATLAANLLHVDSVWQGTTETLETLHNRYSMLMDAHLLTSRKV